VGPLHLLVGLLIGWFQGGQSEIIAYLREFAAIRSRQERTDDRCRPARTLIAPDREAVIETTAGKVPGFTSDGSFNFRGIPYAASTAGRARVRL
jgi:hypothetical protein